MKDNLASMWAITRAAYEAVAARQPGAAAEMSKARPSPTGGVAVIPVEGVMTKADSWLGDVSMRAVGDAVKEADADQSIGTIILLVDSPGGTVAGTEELTGIIASAQTPVIAVCDGQMCSAAYWMASAADRIFLQNKTDVAGSIGVIASHTDISGLESRIGVKTTIVTAGRYKAATSPYDPLTDDGRSVLQGMVDSVYGVFIDTIAANRGVSVEKVLKSMADGRIFTGDEAIKAGLADGYASLTDVIARAAAGDFVKTPRRSAPPSSRKEAKSMDIVTVKAEHPAVAEALYKEGLEAGVKEGFKTGFADGASAETRRIKDIEANALPGHAELVAEMKFDGTTTGAEAAVRILRAEQAKGVTRLAAIERDAAPIAAVTALQPAAPADLSGLPIEDRCKAAWDGDAKVRAEFGTFAPFLAYERARERGSVKILTGKGA